VPAAAKEPTISEIVALEWEMFSSVQSLNGTVSCQEDPSTFEIMRSSQLKSWSEESATSYLDDLRAARAEGRNLLTEKYARMMEHTSPCEFERIRFLLPALEPEAESIIDRLVARLVEWQEEVAATYPFVGAQGRPLRSSEDTAGATSFETYSRGELATYSVRTLRSLEEQYRLAEATGENPAETILRYTVERYGYASIEDAEAALRDRYEAAE
jgi:hypothetical protein